MYSGDNWQNAYGLIVFFGAAITSFKDWYNVSNFPQVIDSLKNHKCTLKKNKAFGLII